MKKALFIDYHHGALISTDLGLPYAFGKYIGALHPNDDALCGATEKA